MLTLRTVTRCLHKEQGAINMSTAASRSDKYQQCTRNSLRNTPRVETRPKDPKCTMKAMDRLFSCTSITGIVEHLVDGGNDPHNSLLSLNSPTIGMLQPKHFEEMAAALSEEANTGTIHEQVSTRTVRCNYA